MPRVVLCGSVPRWSAGDWAVGAVHVYEPVVPLLRCRQGRDLSFHVRINISRSIAKVLYLVYASDLLFCLFATGKLSSFVVAFERRGGWMQLSGRQTHVIGRLRDTPTLPSNLIPQPQQPLERIPKVFSITFNPPPPPCSPHETE